MLKDNEEALKGYCEAINVDGDVLKDGLNALEGGESVLKGYEKSVNE